MFFLSFVPLFGRSISRVRTGITWHILIEPAGHFSKQSPLDDLCPCAFSECKMHIFFSQEFFKWSMEIIRKDFSNLFWSESGFFIVWAIIDDHSAWNMLHRCDIE